MTIPKNNDRKQGVSLTQTVFLIVITGLIMGAAQFAIEMLKNAGVRSLISNKQKYDLSVNTFKIKYGYLPGDLPPSQAVQVGFFTFTGYQAGKGESNCDKGTNYAFGNGDSLIERNESLVFWRQLSDAKMLQPDYGIEKDNPLIADTLSTSPWGGMPTNDVDKIASFIPRASDNRYITPVILCGKDFSTQGWAKNFYQIRPISRINKIDGFASPATAFISLFQVSQIDAKIDDGMPNTGKIISATVAPYKIGNGLTSVKNEEKPEPSWGLNESDHKCTFGGKTADGKGADVEYNLSSGLSEDKCPLYIEFN